MYLDKRILKGELLVYMLLVIGRRFILVICSYFKRVGLRLSQGLDLAAAEFPSGAQFLIHFGFLYILFTYF